MPTPVLRVRPVGPPPKCAVCHTEALVLSGLIGWRDDQPLCPGCLLEASPPLGWALLLAERSAGAISGWPTKTPSPHRRQRTALLELIEAGRRILGPIRPNSPRVKRARELLQAFDRYDRK